MEKEAGAGIGGGGAPRLADIALLAIRGLSDAAGAYAAEKEAACVPENESKCAEMCFINLSKTEHANGSHLHSTASGTERILLRGPASPRAPAKRGRSAR
jgi:hypothetical protein